MSNKEIPTQTNYPLHNPKLPSIKEFIDICERAVCENHLGIDQEDLDEGSHMAPYHSMAVIVSVDNIEILIGEVNETDTIAEAIAGDNMWKADTDLLVKHMGLEVKDSLFVENMKMVLGRRANDVIGELINWRQDLINDMIARHGKAYFISPNNPDHERRSEFEGYDLTYYQLTESTNPNEQFKFEMSR